MLRQRQKEPMTRTGPEPPMAEMFRRYWIPALLAEELPENGCPPVRVRLLSERLIAFRDSDGRCGLTDELCAHGSVSRWFGRNEESGITRLVGAKCLAALQGRDLVEPILVAAALE